MIKYVAFTYVDARNIRILTNGFKKIRDKESKYVIILIYFINLISLIGIKY